MGGVVASITKPISKVFKTVTNFVGDFFSFNVKPMGAPDLPNIQTAEQEQGILLNKTGTSLNIPVVYGYRRVGGSIIFVETNGSTNAYLYVVYVFCEGEIGAYKNIRIDDEDLPVPAQQFHDVNQVVTVSQGRYADRVQYELFTGTDSQAQSTLLTETPSWPTKNRKLPGVAYGVFRYEWRAINSQADADSNPFQGGVPQVQVDMCGRKVFDISTHSTGSQLTNTYENLFKTYGTHASNPVNCLLDYLMNPRYGCGISRDEIEASRFKIAAAKLAQTVTYDTAQEKSGPAMLCYAVIDTKQKLFDNVKILVGACRSMMPYVQGRYRLVVEDAGHPTDITSSVVTIAFDVNKTHIVGPVTLTGEMKTTKYNQVIVNYVDPNLDFTPQQAVFRVDGDVTADEDEELSAEFTFNTVPDYNIARDLARMIYLKSRTQNNIEITCTQELLDVIPGDVIRVSLDTLNLSLNKFRVINMRLRPDGLIDISGTQHVDTNYPYVKTDAPDIPPTPVLPKTVVPAVVVNTPVVTPVVQSTVVVPPVVTDVTPRIGTPWYTPSTLLEIDESTAQNPCIRRKQPASDFLSQASQGLITFVQNKDGAGVGYPYFGARTTSLRFKQPQDEGVKSLLIQVFSGSTLLVQHVRPFPRINNSAIDEPIVLAKGLSYKLRYIKVTSTGEKEYRIGGDLSPSPILFNGYTYKVAGASITDFSIEGFINFLSDNDAQIPRAQGTQSLGG